MHREFEPAIHYWGTPVVLISTLNPDGSTNIAPMSSAWWLGWSCMLGLDASSQTVANLRRQGQCVLNLAGAENAEAVNALARTTGASKVPLHKKALGYRYESKKAQKGGFELLESLQVSPARLLQCPVHLEAEVVSIRPFGAQDPRFAVPACAIELRILKAHIEEELLASPDRVDADSWHPLLMSFRHLYTRGAKLLDSRLARGEGAQYAPWKGRGPKAWATQAALSWSSRKYRVKEEGADEETI